MSELKAQLRADLTAAMKARDELTKATLRMVISAITNEEVSGATARELTDPEVMIVLAREVKKRKESAEAFSAAGRTELAAREVAESSVIQAYLPAQLSDEALSGLVDAAVAEVAEQSGGAVTMKQMGQVIKAVQARAAGQADGGRVSGAVKAALAKI
ncbi:GatB/YqeY domain-containing protein [Nakamurella antarctica]|uniref:GatB/YqeY domain-containing protein n=1 Tax=Nakamurella antarctica TaxID=1902245 RepID=A0A3G8ZJF6_9ACTN|nr:GatB/YqeY domain-containing protein [Nakamurella antarctica]AZI57328.1 GatB/YqeY domain-containing protein [Nakamurella antarctica]